MEQIPEAMYSPKECELILGLPYKAMYRLIREHKVEAVSGIDGKVKVPRDELMRYAKKRERIEQAKKS